MRIVCLSLQSFSKGEDKKKSKEGTQRWLGNGYILADEESWGLGLTQRKEKGESNFN